MKPVDLIGCGALNLDLIYRLPRGFALWDELGPPGSEQLLDADVRRAVDEALAHVRRRAPAAARPPTRLSRSPAWGTGRR